MRLPKRLHRFLAAPFVWLLGGDQPEALPTGEGNATAWYVKVPTHTWNEVELPESNCYLMLGGQTSAFRDRGIHGFRLVLHDTTFRWWTREQGKLGYRSLLLHGQRRLSAQHIELLTRIIEHGDRRQASSDEHFERGLDQDADLSPVFLEFPPARFLFQDNAYWSMLAAYTGLFGLHRRLFAKPAFNCVVAALLFSGEPAQLLAVAPLELHRETRRQARDLNELWRLDFAPVLERAASVFRSFTEAKCSSAPGAKPPWWQRFWPRALLPAVPEAKRRRPLDFREQLTLFRPEFLSQVMLPLKKALLQHDPGLEEQWRARFRLTEELLEYRLEAFQALRSQTSNGCNAASLVDQLLFCPDWRETQHWKKSKASGRPTTQPSGATIVKEVNIFVRKILYWNAANKINSDKGIPDDPHHARSCLSRGGVRECLASTEG